MIARSLDLFVRCQADAGCDWRVLIMTDGRPKLCEDHAPGWHTPQFLDVTDEAGDVLDTIHRNCEFWISREECE